MKASELLPGDIVLDRDHTMIAAGDGYIIDAWGKNANKGVELWHWKEATAVDRTLLAQSVFRSTEAGLGAFAIGYAKVWATVKPTTLITPWRQEGSKRALGTMEKTKYGVSFKHDGKVILDDRRTGVNLAQEGSTVAPPLNYDAIRRALKYALRTERGFSFNRGTTCCAFVISCLQAAALRRVAELSAIEKLFNELTLNRVAKTTGGEFIDGKVLKRADYLISPHATQKVANPGFKGTDKFESKEHAAYLADSVSRLTGAKYKSWEELFGFEISVDAQFTHSNKLLKRLNDETGKDKKFARILNNEIIKLE